jgi:hypothetical protein
VEDFLEDEGGPLALISRIAEWKAEMSTFLALANSVRLGDRIFDTNQIPEGLQSGIMRLP